MPANDREPDTASPSPASRARRTWLRLAIGVIALAVVVYFGRNYLGELWRLRDASPALVALILALYLLTRFLNSEIMRLSLRRLGHVIGMGEAYLITILVTYTNLLIPRAGLGAPAIYLKRRHGVPLADFGSLLMPIAAVQVACIGLAGLACLGLMAAGDEWHGSSGPFAAVFAVCTVVGIGALFLRVPVRASWSGRLAAALRRFSRSWRTLASSMPTVTTIVAVQFVVLTLRAWRLDVAFAAIDQDVWFPGVIIASLLADIMLLLSITPSALGFREAAIALGATMMGVSPEVAVSAAVLDRLIWTIGVIVLAQFGLWRLGRVAPAS